MYSKILKLTYTEAVKAFPQFESVNSIRKVITFKNDSSLSTYSSKSDVIVYYDIVSDSAPLLLIERLKRSDVKLFSLNKAVKKLNKLLSDHVAVTRVSDDKMYVDIVVVKNNIYKSVTEE